MTFRKSKLFITGLAAPPPPPPPPPLNFSREMWKHDNLIAKTHVMSAIAELTLTKKTGSGRKTLSPSMRDNCRLRVKSGSEGDHIYWNRELAVSALKADGLF